MLLTNPQILVKCCHLFCHNVLFLVQDPIQNPHYISLSHVLSLLLSGTFPPSLSFMTLTALKSPGKLLCRMSLSLGLFEVSSWCWIFNEDNRSAIVPSGHSVRRCMTSLRVITGGVPSDHLVEVVSARSLHYEVTVYPVAGNKYLVERSLILTF